jgi:energy-coupling factor transporter transmembrane protein EcfT
MLERWKRDVLTRTGAAAIVFGWFLLGAGLEVLGLAFLVTIVFAIIVRVRPLLLATCLVFPLLPIMASHLLIEPLLSGAPIEPATMQQALRAWIRVGGMALLSVTWLVSLDLRAAAQLCRLTGAGQYLLLPFLIAGTFVSVTRDRWLAIRELQALRGRGRLRGRARLRFRQVPGTGLQLTMASLVSSGELALACNGRGIGARRGLAVARPVPSGVGVMVVLTLVAVTGALIITGSL